MNRVAARAISLLLMAGIVALIIWERPRIGMLISGAIWVGFQMYWARETRRVAPVERQESARSSARHRILREVAFVLLFLPIPGLNALILPGNLTTPIGLTVQIIGAIIYLRAKRELGAAWSGTVSIKVDQQLVRTGPYRWVRHPLYSAMIIMSAGTAIVCNQAHAVIALVLMIVAYAIKIQTEEHWMREQFGAAWDDYRRTTRALIPGVF